MARPFRNLSRLALLSVVTLSLDASATTVESYWQNRKGIKQLQEKSYRSAYQTFMKGLEADPLNPALQMNLGLTFEVNEEYAKAEQAYRGVLRLVPEKSEMQFAALFNLAEALGKEHRIPEALEAYQMALEIHPDSKEVKTNIELLWSQGQGDGKGDPNDKDQKGKDQKKQGQGDGEDKKQQQDKSQDPKDKDPKAKPHPFDSKDLSDKDVKKILDEIKNQEQAIRAQEYERNPKEAPRGKDW